MTQPCNPAVSRRLRVTLDRDASLDAVLPKGERWDIPGRMNLSAGGTMVLEAPRSDAALTQARKAVRALGLRVAAVDMFTDIGGDPDAIRVIEVNSSPSIRLLEQSEPQRSDLENLASHIFRHGIAGATDLKFPQQLPQKARRLIV